MKMWLKTPERETLIHLKKFEFCCLLKDGKIIECEME